MSQYARYFSLSGSGGSGVASLNGLTGVLNLVAGTGISITPLGSNITIAATGVGSGTVTSVSVVSANGFAGTVATATTTPAITLSTTITGVLKGNGTAISAATPGTDYVIPSGSITGTASNITATSNSTLTTLSALSLPGAQVTGNIAGNAANITATSNSTLVTLSALSLPYSQITGAPAAITALTGDATATGPGSVPITLATVNGNVGSFTNANITVNAKGLITAASNGTAGTVTSVAFADASTLPIYNITGSPVTSSGTLTQTLINQSANTIFAGPATGSPAQPAFRALVSADIPNNAANTSGTASNITATSNSTLTTLTALSLPGAQVTGNIAGNAANITATSNSTLTTLSVLSLPFSQVTGTVPVSQGGTSLTTLTANNVILGNGTSAPTFVAPGTSGNVLTSNGTTWTSAPNAGSGANTALSNLVSTSINQDLVSASDLGFNLGAQFNRWFALYTTIVSNGHGTTPLSIQTELGSAGNNSGTISVVSGDISNSTGTSGLISINSGNTTNAGNSAPTGNVVINTGNTAGSGNSGNLVLSSGTVSGGTRGLIQLKNGTEGTSGYVWTSTDTAGSGSWIPSSGGGANTSLSNLITTSINQSLLPSSSGALNLGSSTLLWQNIYTDNILSDSSGLTAQSPVNSTTSGGTGGIVLQSGAITNASNPVHTGNISISSGNTSGSGGTGNITLKTGTGSPRGLIQLVNGTEGTSGYVWTSTDTLGSGSWMPASSGGTVTSVAATVPAFLSISGSPITTAGTLAIGLSGTALPTANGGTNVTSAGTAGNVLVSNGTDWISAPISGSSAFAAYASSLVNTNGSTTSATFVTFSNSPAFTFTPTISGTYKVYSSVAAQQASSGLGNYRIFNTSGGATLLQESQAVSNVGETSVYIQSNYSLTAGNTYVFDIQGSATSGVNELNGGDAPFYMFAEGVSLNGSSIVIPSMRYFASSSTISGSLSTITYSTQDYDNFSAYSGGSYTIPTGQNGKYQVNAGLLFSGTVSLNNTVIMEIQKNSSVVSRRTIYLPAALTDGTVAISDIISCVATDTLRIQVSTSSLTPAIVSSNFDNYLSICKVG